MTEATRTSDTRAFNDIDINNYAQSTGSLNDFLVNEKRESLIDDYDTSRPNSVPTGSTAIDQGAYRSPVINKKRRVFNSADRTSPLQKWEGYILSVDDENYEFRAVIADKTNSSFADEEVTISQDDLSLSDLKYLKPGAVFYWSIGYAYKGATKRKYSDIHFSRLKGFSKKASDNAKKEAEELMELFSAN